ncbi:MAG: hypothetical protein PHW93_02760 [Candidatus Methanomethylophilaceae archaeon]|nr:hypothetical protein [Candidatus Methanomethylophilaceae archaeon]
MEVPYVTCGLTPDEAHKKVAGFIMDRYDGRGGVTVYAKEEHVGSARFYGRTRLYGERADTAECFYTEPDILIERDGKICTVIEIDSATSNVVELAGKAMTPVLSSRSQPQGRSIPLSDDLHMVQIVCMIPTGDSFNNWECRFRSLEDDIAAAYRSMSPGKRYSLILPVKRRDETVEKVLANVLENKIW